MINILYWGNQGGFYCCRWKNKTVSFQCALCTVWYYDAEELSEHVTIYTLTITHFLLLHMHASPSLSVGVNVCVFLHCVTEAMLLLPSPLCQMTGSFKESSCCVSVCLYLCARQSSFARVWYSAASCLVSCALGKHCQSVSWMTIKTEQTSL